MVTVVQVRVTNKPIREYLNGRKGVKQTSHLTVIEKSIDGGDPPDSIRLKGRDETNVPVIGALPSQEIDSYPGGLGVG